jgi:hypothetical protein
MGCPACGLPKGCARHLRRPPPAVGRSVWPGRHRPAHAACDALVSSRADRHSTPACCSVAAATVDDAVAERMLAALNPREVGLALVPPDVAYPDPNRRCGKQAMARLMDSLRRAVCPPGQSVAPRGAAAPTGWHSSTPCLQRAPPKRSTAGSKRCAATPSVPEAHPATAGTHAYTATRPPRFNALQIKKPSK